MPDDPSSTVDRPLLLTAARILGAAIARVVPDAALAGGGVLELPFPGFYQDVARDRPLIPDDIREVSHAFADLAGDDLPLELRTVTREEALSVLGGGGPDLHSSRIPGDSRDTVTLVTLGGFTDLAGGAELPSTGACRSFHIHREVLEGPSGAPGGPPLRRLCGIAARDPDDLRRGVAWLERAMERDHRWVGRALRLFEPVATPSGAWAWLPGGATVHALLRGRVRAHLAGEGFLEVRSAGGALACHDAVYRTEPRGCADLPLRLFELSPDTRPGLPPDRSAGIRGASLLTRDVENVFTPREALSDEVRRLARIAKAMHGTFALPLRAEVTAGRGESLDLAGILEGAGIDTLRVPGPAAVEPEAVFRTANVFGHFQHEAGWIRIEGPREGDELGCVPDGTRRPGVAGAFRTVATIRTSLVSSIESLLAAILERTSGFLPFWLSPVQARVLSVTTDVADYARRVHGALRASGLRCELDARRTKILTKLRDAAVGKVPYTVVVGEREKAGETVSIRSRERFEDPVVLSGDELRAKLLEEVAAGRIAGREEETAP